MTLTKHAISSPPKCETIRKFFMFLGARKTYC